MTICTARSAQSPAVTVVIPAYNSAQYISQTLDSIEAQSFSDYEVIVVNDGSSDSDQLEQALRSHPLEVTYLSQENKGVSAARNAAIQIARGEFYVQLDADDQLKPNYLEAQLEILKNNPDVVLVYPNATIVVAGSEKELEFMEISPSQGEVSFESLVREDCVVMTCVTARMNVIRDAGMFDEDLLSCEDFDLWLRIAKNHGRIVYHREPLVIYRRHAASLSADRVWMGRYLLAVLEKCERTLSLTITEREALDAELSRNRSLLHLFEGKRALKSGQTAAALENFQNANLHLRSSKLSVVIFMLRHMPQLVSRVFSARERLLAKDPNSDLRGFDQPRVW
jgi:glycosyltransferase involved in cell wall biosynthesis